MKTILDRVKEIASDTFGFEQEDISLETKIREDLGADSLDEIEFVVELERNFNVTITDDKAEEMLTIQDVVKTLQNLGVK